jgi:hypothetical protein
MCLLGVEEVIGYIWEVCGSYSHCKPCIYSRLGIIGRAIYKEATLKGVGCMQSRCKLPPHEFLLARIIDDLAQFSQHSLDIRVIPVILLECCLELIACGCSSIVLRHALTNGLQLSIEDTILKDSEIGISIANVVESRLVIETHQHLDDRLLECRSLQFGDDLNALVNLLLHHILEGLIGVGIYEFGQVSEEGLILRDDLLIEIVLDLEGTTFLVVGAIEEEELGLSRIITITDEHSGILAESSIGDIGDTTCGHD